MSKKQILISMLAVVIVAVVLLVIKLNTGTNVIENKKREPTGNKQESLQQEVEQDAEKELQEPNTDKENEEDKSSVVNESKDESGREMTDADINNIEIEIVKMKDTVKEQISDMEAFEYAIKKFFYTFGIMEKEVICMNEVSYLYETNQVSFLMYVSNHSFSYFEVVYDMETGSYKVPVEEE